MDVSLGYEAELHLPLDEAVGWCKSADSRKHWPGVERVSSDSPGLTLFYDVQLRAPGARPAEIRVEEHLTFGDEMIEGNDRRFLSVHVWHWPTGALLSAWATYRFTEHEHGEVGIPRLPGPPPSPWTHLQFDLAYVLPGPLLGQLTDRFRFGKSIARAAETYVRGLESGAARIPAA